MNKILLGAFIFSITTSCYALTCPTNFSIINVGDSIESVKALCGKPDSEKKTEQEKPVPQEWTYFVTETVATNTSYSTTGTLKTTFTFDKEDKAINISVNGIGVGATTICGAPINLGATREQVKKACGEPSFINKQQSDASKEGMDTIIDYIYNSNPPATLTFTNGVLTGSK